MSLQVANISKAFDATKVLKSVSLTADEGEFLALLGPSGSGKTTLLRVIAGLESAETGGVTFRGEDLLAKPVRERGIGLVFQHYALFRHMTAAQNVAFGMRSKPWRARPSARQIRAKVAELLKLVQLDGLGDRFPNQLSGGQRQRVALARALAIEPSILLLDEPFGALDAKVRRELRLWLRDIHERTGLTTIFVTHDQEEALELADRVAVLREGALEQVGTPEALYHEPASAFVFDFLGDTVHAPCTIEGDVALIAGARVPILGPHPASGASTAYMRPHELMITPGEGQGLLASVRDVSRAGPDARVDCTLDQGGAVDVRVAHDVAGQFKPRDRVTVLPSAVRVWAS